MGGNKAVRPSKTMRRVVSCGVASSSLTVNFHHAGNGNSSQERGARESERVMAGAKLRWVLQLHKDVPKAATFYSEGLDFTVNLCTLRWAELQSGSLNLALLQPSSDYVIPKAHSPFLSFTVPDLYGTVTKLAALGAELDGPIKHEIHGKVAAMRCLDGHIIGLYEPL